MMITKNPEIASFAVDCGVDMIFVDMEINGKELRQSHLNSVISKHTIDDVIKVREAIPKGRLLVRVNPLHSKSRFEIDEVISAGADMLMLPMYTTNDEIKKFIFMIDGRASSCLLAETVDALKIMHQSVSIPGINQVHIGLNDLSIQLGSKFMFEPLITSLVGNACEALKNSNITFGIGGLARVGEGLVPAELLLSEHIFLGSTWAILSRTFHRGVDSLTNLQLEMNFQHEINKLTNEYAKRKHLTRFDLRCERQLLREKINNLASQSGCKKYDS